VPVPEYARPPLQFPLLAFATVELWGAFTSLPSSGEAEQFRSVGRTLRWAVVCQDGESSVGRDRERPTGEVRVLRRCGLRLDSAALHLGWAPMTVLILPLV